MRARLAAAAAGLALLAGCNGQLDHLGRAPSMSPSGALPKPVPPPAPERLAVQPPPPPPPDTAQTASLWTSAPESLFGDRRAKRRGDILTVSIEIDEEAEIENTTTRDRQGNDNIEIADLLGLDTVADTILPGASTLNPAIDIEGEQGSTGRGQIERSEEITLRVAATVEDVLPNGHLVIRGSQELRVNFEVRELQVTGIVRPEDISRQNMITLDQIADARVVYGGRGQITDLQQPRIGQQVIDLVSPF